MEKRRDKVSSPMRLAPNLMLVAWPEGRVSWLSEELASLLGVTVGEAIGSELDTLTKGEKAPALRQLLYQPSGSLLHIPIKAEEQDELFAVRVDRGDRFLLLEFKSADNQQTTEAEAGGADNARSAAHEGFEQTIQSLHRYKGSVYHDLVSPINSIKGFVDLLVEDYGEKLGDYGIFALEVIRNSAGKLSDLINGLNRLSRLEQVVPNPQTLDIELLIQQAWQSVLDKELSDGREVELHLKRPPASPITDPKLLSTLLEIGFSNAVKFTRSQTQAQVWVEASEHGDQWRFTIRDNGIGFDPRNGEKAFGLFTRLVSDDDYPGIGLGLAIAGRIIERLNGRIWLETIRHKGTSLIWEIPQGRA